MNDNYERLLQVARMSATYDIPDRNLVVLYNSSGSRISLKEVVLSCIEAAGDYMTVDEINEVFDWAMTVFDIPRVK